MSGTSADSIDSALVDLSKNKCELLEKESTPINKKLKNKIFETINRKNINQNEIDILDLEMGKLFGKAVLDLLRKASVEANKIERITAPRLDWKMRRWIDRPIERRQDKTTNKKHEVIYLLF